MSRIYDVSMMINEKMTVWKNRESKRPKIRMESDFTTSSAHESSIWMNVHTGTHLDAPLHMLDRGKTIETIPLERLVGDARVLDLTNVKGGISRTDLEPFAIQKGEWILFKTQNSYTESFDMEFVFLRADGAAYLQEIGINGVGIDALGIERDQDGHPTHKTLFREDILILEGLRLKDIEPGNYMLIVAPLKMEGIDAAPARVMLIGT